MTTRWIPAGARDHYRSTIEVGDMVGFDFAAYEVTHMQQMTEPRGGFDTRVTLTRRYGPAHDRENKFGDLVLRISSRWPRLEFYRDGRIYLCSCCGHPAPCRMEVALEQSAAAAKLFEERLARMGPGLCYGCGEVITQRQERVTFPGEHADFPGRSGPTFHTRQKCYAARRWYAQRAGMTPEAEPISTEESA